MFWHKDCYPFSRNRGGYVSDNNIYGLDVVLIRDVNENQRFDVGIDKIWSKEVSDGKYTRYLRPDAPEVRALEDYFDITSLDGLPLRAAADYLINLHLASLLIPLGDIRGCWYLKDARSFARKAGVRFDVEYEKAILRQSNNVSRFLLPDDSGDPDAEFSPFFFLPPPKIQDETSVMIGIGEKKYFLRGKKVNAKGNDFLLDPSQIRGITVPLKKSATQKERASLVLYSPEYTFLIRQGITAVERKSALYFPFVPVGQYELRVWDGSYDEPMKWQEERVIVK